MSDSKRPQQPMPTPAGPSRFIPVIFLLVALALVILSAMLTRRATEDRLLLATQTGQALINAENTRQAMATITVIATVTP